MPNSKNRAGFSGCHSAPNLRLKPLSLSHSAASLKRCPDTKLGLETLLKNVALGIAGATKIRLVPPDDAGSIGGLCRE